MKVVDCLRRNDIVTRVFAYAHVNVIHVQQRDSSVGFLFEIFFYFFRSLIYLSKQSFIRIYLYYKLIQITLFITILIKSHTFSILLFELRKTSHMLSMSEVLNTTSSCFLFRFFCLSDFSLCFLSMQYVFLTDLDTFSGSILSCVGPSFDMCWWIVHSIVLVWICLSMSLSGRPVIGLVYVLSALAFAT